MGKANCFKLEANVPETERIRTLIAKHYELVDAVSNNANEIERVVLSLNIKLNPAKKPLEKVCRNCAYYKKSNYGWRCRHERGGYYNILVGGGDTCGSWENGLSAGGHKPC